MPGRNLSDYPKELSPVEEPGLFPDCLCEPQQCSINVVSLETLLPVIRNKW